MRINDVVIERVKDFADFKRFVDQLGIKPKHLIIKPNWVELIEGSYTETKALEFLFKSFDCPKTIIESYTFWRKENLNAASMLHLCYIVDNCLEREI